jgi:hypothetical protein
MLILVLQHVWLTHPMCFCSKMVKEESRLSESISTFQTSQSFPSSSPILSLLFMPTLTHQLPAKLSRICTQRTHQHFVQIPSLHLHTHVSFQMSIPLAPSLSTGLPRLCLCSLSPSLPRSFESPFLLPPVSVSRSAPPCSSVSFPVLVLRLCFALFLLLSPPGHGFELPW